MEKSRRSAVHSISPRMRNDGQSVVTLPPSYPPDLELHRQSTANMHETAISVRCAWFEMLSCHNQNWQRGHGVLQDQICPSVSVRFCSWALTYMKKASRQCGYIPLSALADMMWPAPWEPALTPPNDGLSPELWAEINPFSLSWFWEVFHNRNRTRLHKADKKKGDKD